MRIEKDFVDEEVFLECLLTPKDVEIIKDGNGLIAKIKIMGKWYHVAIREEDQQ